MKNHMITNIGKKLIVQQYLMLVEKYLVLAVLQYDRTKIYFS